MLVEQLLRPGSRQFRPTRCNQRSRLAVSEHRPGPPRLWLSRHCEHVLELCVHLILQLLLPHTSAHTFAVQPARIDRRAVVAPQDQHALDAHHPDGPGARLALRLVLAPTPKHDLPHACYRSRVGVQGTAERKVRCAISQFLLCCSEQCSALRQAWLQADSLDIRWRTTHALRPRTTSYSTIRLSREQLCVASRLCLSLAGHPPAGYFLQPPAIECPRGAMRA